MRSLIEREEKIKEKEVYLMNAEKNFQTADQMLREKETVLNSREEILRNRESSLTEREMKLTWERQQLDERRRELLLEQEKRQSMARKVMSSKLSEPMAIDSGSLHDTTTVTTTATASKTNSLSTNTTASHAMHSTTASTASTSQANVSNTMERFFAALAADQGQNTRTFPRRKTGLSAGRHSLQAASVYRTSGSNGSITNVFSAQQTSSSEALDLGGTYASGQLASNSGNAPKTASTENPSTASKLLQGQSYTYQGANGKETRLSGRLGQLPSLSSGGSAATSLSTADSQRLRGKSKSASALVASMSSTSLSSKTPAPSSSINPFVVPEFMKPSAATTSAGGLTGVSSNHNSIPGLTFTASTTLLTTSPTTNLDMQMSDTTDSSSQPSSVSVNTGNSLRPTSTPNSSSSRSLYPPFSSSSVTTSRLSSIRPHLIPSIGHSRFNSALASSSAGSNSHSTLSTASASIPSLNSNDTQSLAAASATNGNAVAQDTSTTPSKSQSATNFGDERFQRHSTPERSQRLEDEDLRMEWDDDIPSPFIKKTYQRPPPAGSGGPLPYRNLMGS
ncbi:hypothetical protein BC939DRAFT_284443 [Gamsiella multidivaricata]|uniref:uncharacterized protein n=1 Tax=Gamsiella multidivaricata TaxID=101098 RepID=UPI00221EEDFC|nr:uncharacterized protein BC939DRAFT_284443 [Gamsiella multidivaricata]KAI7830509.1 hypothetical protein BC939DRAFT_284443 [Gamsiella multidivaricata]